MPSTTEITQRKRCAFEGAAKDRFSSAYPGATIAFDHNLCGHPLLEMEPLIALGARLPADLTEFNLSDIGVSQPDETMIPKNNLTIEETLRNIDRCGSWACLHNIEVDPDYRALMDACLAEITPIVRPRTGKKWIPEGYIFVSSPGAVTPYHFDPQYNILMQLAGSKDIAVFPANSEVAAPTEAHENYHYTGLANLPYKEEIMEPVATVHRMKAGDAVYIPLKAPHWVKTGPEVSVSFSITWRSEESDRQRRVYLVNHWLRRKGLNPGRYGATPLRDRAKGFAYRVFERVGKPGSDTRAD